MRTVDYSEILHGSAALAGFSAGDLDGGLFALWRTFHDRRLQVAWEIHRWPELCPVEQRYYRPLWSAGETVVATDERFYVPTQNYYQALQASTGQAPELLQPDGTYLPNLAYWAVSAGSYTADDFIATVVYNLGDRDAQSGGQPILSVVRRGPATVYKRAGQPLRHPGGDADVGIERRRLSDEGVDREGGLSGDGGAGGLDHV